MVISMQKVNPKRQEKFQMKLFCLLRTDALGKGINYERRMAFQPVYEKDYHKFKSINCSPQGR